MKKILSALLLMLILSPVFVNAEGYTPLEPLPCIPGKGGVTTCYTSANDQVNFKDYVQYVFNFTIFVAGAAAVFMIVLGGFQYMTTDSWSGKSAGLEKVKNALLGLLLVLSSYLILRTIDPRLVAIPSSLVKPLTIKTNDAVYGDLLGTIDAQANKYFLENEMAKAQATQSATTLTQLQDTNKTLESQIYDAAVRSGVTDTSSTKAICDKTTLDWDPSLYKMCTDWMSNNIKITDEQKNLALLQDKAAISKIAADCLSSQYINFNDCQGKIEQARLAAIASADAAQITTDTLKKSIDDYAYTASTIVKLNGLVDGWGDKATIDSRDAGHLIAIEQDALAKITDSASKQELIKATNDLILKSGGDQKLIDNGSYLSAWNNFSAPGTGPTF